MAVRRKNGRITGEGRTRKGRGVGGNIAGKGSTATAAMRGRRLKGRVGVGAEVERDAERALLLKVTVEKGHTLICSNNNGIINQLEFNHKSEPLLLPTRIESDHLVLLINIVDDYCYWSLIVVISVINLVHILLSERRAFWIIQARRLFQVCYWVLRIDSSIYSSQLSVRYMSQVEIVFF